MIMLTTDRLDGNIVPAEFQGTGSESETLAEDFSADFSESQLTTICNVASQFLTATKCKTAAIVTTAYYLRSLDEFAGPSIGDLRRVTAFLYEYAVASGHVPHEDCDAVTERVLEHHAAEQYPWHQSIDAAILDAREWIRGSSVPPEIRYVLQQLGIKSNWRYVVICVAWALQKRCGDDWYIAKTIGDELARHGIDCPIEGRTIRKLLQDMRECRLTEPVKLYEAFGAKSRCNTYRFTIPDDFVAPETHDRTLRATFFTNPTEALAPIYSGLIPVPAAGPLSDITVAAAPTNTPDDSSPIRDQSHSGR